MKIEITATNDGLVAIRHLNGDVTLLTPNEAEVEANHWREPFRSQILEAMDEARDKIHSVSP